VAGDDGPGLAPGVLLSDTGSVEPLDGGPRPLHALTHHPGHTLLALGGPRTNPTEVRDLVSELIRFRGPVVSSVVGLSTSPSDGSAGWIDTSIAAQFGIGGMTILAVRPDRYVGFRDNEGNPDAVATYLEALIA
jgi:hypothetical protein